MQNPTKLNASREVQFFLLIALMFTLMQQAHAFLANLGFWRTQTYTLKYTTVTQSVYAGNCSGVVTVGTYHPNGVLTNVSSTLTVNLNGATTTTFYSDSSCINPISNFTIASGSSSGSFYFSDTSTSAITLTASAIHYKSALQSETISTNPYVWTGGGGNSSWSTAANWSGGGPRRAHPMARSSMELA